MQKHVNLVDLVKSFPTNIFLQNLASIQKRTIPVKFAHLAVKSENGSISNLPTKVHPLWRYCETCSCCSASSLTGSKTSFAPKWEAVDAVAFIQTAVSDQQVATTIFHTFCSRMTRHVHHGFVLRCLERKRRRNISSVIGEDVLAISSKGLKIDDISQRSFTIKRLPYNYIQIINRRKYIV